MSVILTDGTLVGTNGTKAEYMVSTAYDQWTKSPDIDGSEGWAVGKGDKAPWILIKIPPGKHVQMLVTQGRNSERYAQWVTQYVLGVRGAILV